MILDRPFDQNTFKSFISEFLPDFISNEREVRTPENSLLKTVYLMGTSMACNISVLSAFCDEANSGKRIGITQSAFKMLREHQIRNAIIAVHHGGGQWRLSLLTSTLELRDGKIVSKDSNPRRYSYLLGIGAKTNTPYKFLIEKGRVSDIESLRERFSVEIVNKQFFDAIATLFTELVGGERSGKKYPGVLKLQGGTPGSQLYQEFAVRLIGRIVFCWFLQEKKSDAGIPLIPEKLLSVDAVKNDWGYYHNTLEPLFFEVLNKRKNDRPEDLCKEEFDSVPYLNGGLFNPHYNDGYKYDAFVGGGAYGLLNIPNEWFISLFELLSQYNFTIDENTTYDVDLSIDPEMLGRIFENLLAEINPETGDSARKSTGSFYTPREIVEYMVDSSLTYFLVGKTQVAEEKLRALISYSKEDDEEYPLTDNEKKQVVDALAGLRILDPACGSGAFPIGILQKTVFILQQADETSELWLKKQLEGITSIELRRDVEGKYKTENYDYLRKLGVIRESIFGVDIQTIATEISKLRCFLTLIIEECINDDADNRGIKPLPNLDFKFVTANSLVGLPEESASNRGQLNILEDIDQMSELKKIRDGYFSADSNNRERFRNDFDRLQKQMLTKNIDVYKGNVTGRYNLLMRWEPFDNVQTEWFDSEWMFGVEKFDIVIGNPPYIGEKGNKPIFDILKQSSLGKRFYLGKMDLFYFFFHLGLDSLSGDGTLSFITTNYYPTADGAKKLRADIKARTDVLRLINFNELTIFESAKGQHDMITILSRRSDLPHQFEGESGFCKDTLQIFAKEKKTITSETLSQVLNGQSELVTVAIQPRSNLFDCKDNYIRFANGTGLDAVLDKVAKVGDPLAYFATINQGIVSGADKFSDAHRRKFSQVQATKGEGIFVFPKGELCKIFDDQDIIKPWFKNSDISRWATSSFSDKELIYADGMMPLPKSIVDYLEKFKPILVARREFKDGKRPWYELHWPRDRKIFDGEKIIVPQRSCLNTFAYNQIPWYASADVYFITPREGVRFEPKSLLGILNSRLIYTWLYNRGKRKGEMLELYGTPLSEIPIVPATDEQKKGISCLVNQIISLKENNIHADTQSLEIEIDKLIYELYDLTKDEIAIIEAI